MREIQSVNICPVIVEVNIYKAGLQIQVRQIII